MNALWPKHPVSPGAGGGAPTLPGVTIGDILVWDGTKWVPNDQGAPSLGDVLVWDGTTWSLQPAMPFPGYGAAPPATAFLSNAGVSLTAARSDHTHQQDPYITQTDWGVNSATGNDNNAGTAASPLLTLAELARRWNGRTFAPGIGTVTVALTGDFPTQFIDALVDMSNQRVNWVGSPTQQATGTVNAYTAPNAATNQDAQLQSTALSFATHVQRRIRLTSGANAGAIAWVLKDLGANTARVSQFVNPTTLAAVSPAANDTFDVETLGTRIGGFNCRIANGVGSISNLAIEPDAPGGRLSFGACDGSASQFLVTGCRIQTQQLGFVIGSALRLSACSNVSTLSSGLAALILSGHAGFATVQANQGRVIFAVAQSFMQNAQIAASLGAFVSAQVNVGSFDRTGANPNVDVDVLGQVDLTAVLWGINNTNTVQAVRLRSRAGITWSTAGNIPTITTSGVVPGDVLIGGTATTWAAVAAAAQSAIMNANNGAMAGLRS